MVRLYFTRWDALIPWFFSQLLIQLPEHLKNYYKIWCENGSKVNSLQQNQAVYAQLAKLLVRLGSVPHIPMQPHTALDQQIDSSRHITQIPSDITMWHMGICSTVLVPYKWQFNLRTANTHHSKTRQKVRNEHSRTMVEVVLQSKSHALIPV
jgi:hypothetical protein